MSRETTPEVATIAARYMDHEDPNVRTIAASVLAQFEQAGGLTQEPTMASANDTFTYKGSDDTKYVSGQTFTKGEVTKVTDQGVIGMIRELYADEFKEGAPKPKAEAPKEPEPKAEEPEPSASVQPQPEPSERLQSSQKPNQPRSNPQR